MSIVRCKVCLKEFYVKPSHQKLGWGKFCSRDCQWQAQLKGRYVNCFTCGKKIYKAPKALNRSKSGNFFCNKRCQTIWRNQVYVGEKSYNWKNGEKAYRQILKRSDRKMTCFNCKANDKRVLAVHHRDHNRSNNNLSNLIWLCYNCHFLVHHDIELNRKIMEALV